MSLSPGQCLIKSISITSSDGKTISKDNKIHTIYFGMNGIGCNANDYYTKDHLIYEEMLDDNSLFTPQNKKMMQMEFEKLMLNDEY